MKTYLLVFAILFLAFTKTNAQNCGSGFQLVTFPEENQIAISACIENEVGLGKQSVYWTAENLSNEKVEIKFVKVVYTTCGKTQRTNGSTILKPKQKVTGRTFSGEITFESQIWKEDCNASKDRIDRVEYEDLTIKKLKY